MYLFCILFFFLLQITVKFARTENDSIRKAREKSFNFISQKNADEPWCETMWYNKNSQQAVLEREKLFSVSTNSQLSKFYLLLINSFEQLCCVSRQYAESFKRRVPAIVDN